MTSDDELRRIHEIQLLVEMRRQGSRLDREAWVGAARQLFSPGERQACHVCGRFKGIAQAHHVVPLTTQYDRGFKYPDPEFAWLCPNHHTIVHLFIPADERSMALPAMLARDRTVSALLADLSEDEFNLVMDLMRRSGRAPE